MGGGSLEQSIVCIFCVCDVVWEGCSIQVGWSPILCVLYLDPAESHSVWGATYRPASRDRYPIPSHTRVGDRKPNLATSQLYDWAKLSGCRTKTWRVGGVKCHFCWSEEGEKNCLVDVDILLILLLLL